MSSKLIAVGVLFLSGTAFADYSVKEVAKELTDFSVACSYIPHAKTIVEKSNRNLTDTRLVKKLMQRLGKSLPGYRRNWDSSLFEQRALRGLEAESFTGSFLLNESCQVKTKKLEQKYEFLGLLATNTDGQKAEGYITQKKIGNESYQFIVLSQRKDPITATMPGFYGFNDLKIDVTDELTLSDNAVVKMARGQKNPLVNDIQERQFLKARATLIDFDSTAYGIAVYEGRYIGDSFTNWIFSEGIDLQSGDEFDIIYFNEMDDGSYSFYFKKNSSELIHIYYEN